MNDKITILLAGEFLTERSPLRMVLAAHERFSIVGAVSNCVDLLAKAAELNPQIILLDLDLKEGNVIETLVTLKARYPTVRILVLTRHRDDETVFAVIKAGAMGYVLTDESEQFMLHAIADVARGESALSPLIARKLIRELHRPAQLPPSEEPLNDNEVEVLIWLGRGLTNQAIAVRLLISERTVRTHVSNILSKLHLANRTQAALWAQNERLLIDHRFSPQYQRVQQICRQLRNTLEGNLDGEPAFFVGGKAYAVYLSDTSHEHDFVLLLPLPRGDQPTLLKQAPHKFFPAPRYANQGWIALDLSQVDEEELRYYLHQAWRLVAT